MSTISGNTIDELLIFFADHEKSSQEAKNYLDSKTTSGWKIVSLGVKGISGLELAINNVANIQQLTICIPNGPQDLLSLKPNRNLFKTKGHIVFLDIDSKPDASHELTDNREMDALLLANGRHLLADKSGVVGLSTQPFSETARHYWSNRRITQFHLNGNGHIQLRKTITPAHLKCG